MLTEKDIAAALLECQNKRKTVDELFKLLVEWDSSLEQMENALRSLSPISRNAEAIEQRVREVQLSLPGMDIPDSVEIGAPKKARGHRRKDSKKPDVQIIEDILLEYGPLHVTDLVEIGPSKGVSFAGSKKPTLMARDKMYGSKRFYNFGNNVWGLPGQELPDRYKEHSSDNHQSNFSVHAEAEQPDIKIVA